MSLIAAPVTWHPMRIMRRAATVMTLTAICIALTACAATPAPRASSSLPGVQMKQPDPGRTAADHASQTTDDPALAAGNPNGHAYVPPSARAVTTSDPNHVVGSGTPASCTSAALVQAVAEGGVITFNCGPKPVTITMTATAKVMNTSHQVVLDGGGLVTLNGADKYQILYMNTCDASQVLTTNDCIDQQWPQLIVQNLIFEDGYSAVQQNVHTPYGGGGGGAIYAEGGQLKVVNSLFVDNRCYKAGPDLGGAAIRALVQYRSDPVYITDDTFRGGVCSNGGALSSIDTTWDVINSVMTGNKAVGWGANPAQSGTPGGGSGGAIYNDGANFNLSIAGTVIRGNEAREGGGAIFFVVDNNQGTLTIEDSALTDNPSQGFSTRGYPGIFYHSSGHPIVIHSKLK